MVHLDYASGEGQPRLNDDCGHGHDVLVTGKKAKSGPKEIMFRSFHILHTELKRSLIQASSEGLVTTSNFLIACWQGSVRRGGGKKS